MSMNPALAVLVHVLGALLILIDILVWLITGGPVWMIMKIKEIPSTWAEPVDSVDINGKGNAASKVWRSTIAIASGKLSTRPFPEVNTLWDMLERTYKANASKPAQGSRPLLASKVEEGQKFPTRIFGPAQYVTYAQVRKDVVDLGAGLRALGLSPQGEGDFDSMAGKFKILMYEDTCREWMVCCQGAFSQNMVVATAYATLGMDAVVHAVNQGGVTAIVTNRKTVDTVVARSGDMPSLEVIIYTDFNLTPEEREGQKTAAGKLKVVSFNDVLELGRSKPVPASPPKADSVAVLMYTSGSTGNPKGVVIRHRQMLAMIGAIHQQFHVLIDGHETFISYLTLAHIITLAMEFFSYCVGVTVCYADPKCLVAGPGSCGPKGALEEFKPALMIGVPKVWETLVKKLEDKIDKQSAVAKFFVKMSMKYKKNAIRTHRYTPVIDFFIFKLAIKVGKISGGMMKAAVSGGGSISADVQETVRCLFGCPMIQGYGLTETCGPATVGHPLDPSLGVAGSATCSCEITLHSEPEITDANGKPYLASDTTHVDGKPCVGRGEVWIRGPSITSGYYKQPELTKEEFRDDGWFQTGDVGIMLPAGQLKIVDRKKNLVKLKGGEYVAIEMMNVTYNECDIVDVDAGGVCCYADATVDRAVAFAQVRASALKELAEEAGVTGKQGIELSRDPKVMKAALARFNKVAKASSLPALMHVVGVMPLVDPWSPENGCLTPTTKIVPKAVYKRHAADLEVLKKLGIRG